MRVLLWTGPGAMDLREAPAPTPTTGELLLRVESVGICGSELSGFLGQSSIRKPPLVMGHEFTGTLVGPVPPGTVLGDGSLASEGQAVVVNPLVSCGMCDRCRAGLPNICRNRQLIGAARPGGFADLVAVPADHAFPRHPALDADSAALAEPLACAVRAVSLSGLGSGDAAVVFGAGTIGLFCLAVARAAGASPLIVTDTSDARLATAQRWGADVTLNPLRDDVLAEIERRAAGGVVAAIDAVGADATRAQAVKAVVPGGRVVLVGLHDEQSELHINYIVRQEVELRGCFGYTPIDFAHAVEHLEAGLVRATPDWLDPRPLEAGPSSFADLIAGTVGYSKVMLHP